MFSVVLPAYNEEAGIQATIESLHAMFEREGYQDAEIIVVDDGSSDRTAEVARAHGAQVVTHLVNHGYGRSLKDGIVVARHDTIVTADADGTYPIDMLPTLLAAYERGFDMVIGARTGDAYRESWYKMPLRHLLTFLVEFSAGTKIQDVNSGLRVFSKRTIRRYFKQLSNSFSFSTSSTLAYLMTGRCIHFVPIPYFERIGRSKVRLVRDALRTLQFIVQAILYYNPIKLFLLFCCAVLGIGLGFFVIAAITKLLSAFLLGVGSILLSILIFSLGLLADLLRQILIQRERDVLSVAEKDR